jgi:hemoglobin
MRRSQDASTAYAILGGAAPVRAIVDDLYNRITNDDQLRPYFSQTDLGRLKGHLRGFITGASGGPGVYLGRSMADAQLASLKREVAPARNPA